MPIEILEFGELRRSAESQVAALDASDNDPSLDRRAVRRAARLGQPYAPYVALFAVERGEILSRVGVIRREMVTAAGRLRFTGITDVVTRPDAGRRGLAARLLRAVHRRERSAGMPWTFLWTRRSWGAHRLYETLGYEDLLSLPVAVVKLRRGQRPRRPAGFSLQRARATDAGRIEAVFHAATRGRLGYPQRRPGTLRLRFSMGWRKPEEHLILRHGRTAVGYAYATEGPHHVAVHEALVTDPSHQAILLDLLERLGGDRFLGFTSTTFVNDAAPDLRERGFTIWPSSHAVLMGRSLERVSRSDRAAVKDVFRDPRLSCHRGDMF